MPPAYFYGKTGDTMNQKRKVLYIASTFGHLASFHQPYLEWFAEQGYIVHAAAGGEACELPGVSRYIPLPFEKAMFSPANVKAAFQLRHVLREERYALVSLHTSLAAFFARLSIRMLGKNRPVVMNTAHGYLFDQDTPQPKRSILLQAERVTASVTDWLLTMNQQDEVIANQYHLGKRIVPTHGMGVDMERFHRPTEARRSEARKKLGLRPNEVALVYAAEFSGRKNQAMLIRAMHKLPENLVLLLPGTGALLESCRELAQETGVAQRIYFPGFVRDMETYYQAADICVSASRSEGLPFNIMEAMACGLPVVASNVKGHQDLIQSGENGFLYPYDDSDAFVGAVMQLMREQERCKMGERAQESVAPYDIKNVFPELTALYRKALESDGAAKTRRM